MQGFLVILWHTWTAVPSSFEPKTTVLPEVPESYQSGRATAHEIFPARRHLPSLRKLSSAMPPSLDYPACMTDLLPYELTRRSFCCNTKTHSFPGSSQIVVQESVSAIQTTSSSSENERSSYSKFTGLISNCQTSAGVSVKRYCIFERFHI